MSFQALIVALKGGYTSGNWRHVGRPGKLGGSAPGGGHHSIKEYSQEFVNIVDEVLNK